MSAEERKQALDDVDRIAHAFHDAYERLAPSHGYKTRDASAVPWEEVPENNANLMRAVVTELLDTGVVKVGRRPALGPPQVEGQHQFWPPEAT